MSRSAWGLNEEKEPCTEMRLHVYCKHAIHTVYEDISTPLEYWFEPVINPLVRIKCMTGKRRAVKEKKRRQEKDV